MAVYDELGNELSAVYDESGTELDHAYDELGNVIYTRGSPLYPSELTLLHSTVLSSGSPQGMATYGDYIFQFFTNVNKMRIYNRSDYSLVNELNCTVIGHGNNLQFGTEEQASGFPYLYASDSNAADARYIYVLNVSLQSLELVRTISLPATVGNYPNAVIDFEHNKIYTLGYTADSVYTETGRYIACILDLNDPSTVIDTWQLNYLGVMNGLVWNGSYIVLNANTWDGYDAKFYFINPVSHMITNTLELDKEYDSEFQGFSFEGSYYLLSKWIYRTVSNVRTLYYEFYSLS